MLDKIYKITEFSPCISTENQGDMIIRLNCEKVFDEIFPSSIRVLIPTREHLSKISMKHIASADYAFVCGTNLLASDMKKTQQWRINIFDAIGARLGGAHKKEIFAWNQLIRKVDNTHVVLLGAGWHQYQGKITAYTKMLLSVLLDRKYLHSVRDSYTESKLKEAGFSNVVNTACPTMWGLTEEFCQAIPRTKARDVVTTFTNYNKNRKHDEELLMILKRNYRKVYLWLQAIEDKEYLESFPKFGGGIAIVPPSISAYTALLESGDIDYVGTRLHGGIHALNCGRRSLILAVDNRAKEIARDTNLPVLDRDVDAGILEERINSSWSTEIQLPYENIYEWKHQF